MRREAEGRTQDFRTPFYAKRVNGTLLPPQRDVIVKVLESKMSSGDLDRSLDGLVLPLEEAEKGDIGPWSMYKPYSLDGPKKVQAVYQDKPLRLETGPKEKTLSRLESMIPLRSLNRISIEDGIRGLSTSRQDVGEEGPTGLDTTTNSGAPYFNPGRKPNPDMDEERVQYVKEIYNYYLQAAKSLDEALRTPGNVPEFYAVMSHRLVPKGPEPYAPKSKRIVIAMPKEDAILGKTFSVPLISWGKTYVYNGIRPMIGWTDPPTIDREMQILLDKASKRGQIVVSGDVSGFDASFPPELIIEIGKVLGRWFRDGGDIIENLVRAMVYNTHLITPNKVWEATMSSMKSGTWGTNILDSLGVTFALFYGEEMGLYTLENYCTLGDDFLVLGEGVNADSIAEAMRLCGFESHPEKQFVEKDAVHFLQRLHVKDRIGGIASVMRTLNHALGFETMEYRPGDFNRYSYVVRALSQLQNCAFSPYFIPLIETLKEGDAEQLGAKFTNPKDIVSQAGKAGKRILSEDTNAPWKRRGVAFENWAVNGVLRGEKLPPPGIALYRRVYGTDQPD
jgi:hypothetical protein